ncbi:hypothetical protein J6590_087841 [Homalodisca vitripennis]|nr:hypothetical protein J6590_087841 [Homalodisca vitripennis]
MFVVLPAKERTVSLLSSIAKDKDSALSLEAFQPEARSASDKTEGDVLMIGTGIILDHPPVRNSSCESLRRKSDIGDGLSVTWSSESGCTPHIRDH